MDTALVPVTPRLDWLDANLSGWYTLATMKREPFPIDLADPDAILEKLSQVEGHVLAEREKLKDVRDTLTYWEGLHLRLIALAGQNGGAPAESVKQNIRRRILEVVNETDVPIDVDFVMGFLPPGTKRKTVSWNLWDLERDGQIKRITKGVYARLEFEPNTLLKD